MNTALTKQSSTPRGEIFISDQAIAAVVRGALGEVHGIYGLSPENKDGGVLAAFSKGAKQSDIHIVSDEGGSLRVRLHLVIEYGLKLDEVAREVIQTVRERVQTLAGVEVADVDVEIKGLHYPETASPSA